jgi:hypothetical protein
MPRKRKSVNAEIPARTAGPSENYDLLVTGISGLLDEARGTVVRSANSVIVAAYWEVDGLSSSGFVSMARICSHGWRVRNLEERAGSR